MRVCNVQFRACVCMHVCVLCVCVCVCACVSKILHHGVITHCVPLGGDGCCVQHVGHGWTGSVLRHSPVLPVKEHTVPGGVEHGRRGEGSPPPPAMAAQHSGNWADAMTSSLLLHSSAIVPGTKLSYHYCGHPLGQASPGKVPGTERALHQVDQIHLREDRIPISLTVCHRRALSFLVLVV